MVLRHTFKMPYANFVEYTSESLVACIVPISFKMSWHYTSEVE